jgi:hypothetical protein
MPNPWWTNLPTRNGPILVDTFGRVALGEFHTAFPMDAEPFFVFRDVENKKDRVLRTDGRRMLEQIAVLDGPVRIETGYTLLAALLICEDGFNVSDLLPESMHYDRATDTIVWDVVYDRFGIPINSVVVFGDAFQGKLNISHRETRPGLVAPAPAEDRNDTAGQRERGPWT